MLKSWPRWISSNKFFTPIKKCGKTCIVRKLVLYLWCDKKQVSMKLTEKEEELIRAIRNYRKSYPNGHPQLLYYASQLFDELIEVF
ncbi:TPA_asm: clamp loader of DNA polymerase [Porphyromonas phage phage028a_KCOM2799]|uniref:Clamp loader of DNA polymerase n=12 Tax=Viruses TaxID=10239 RepID=A0AAT9JEZ7_9CAUD